MRPDFSDPVFAQYKQYYDDKSNVFIIRETIVPVKYLMKYLMHLTPRFYSEIEQSDLFEFSSKALKPIKYLHTVPTDTSAGPTAPN